MACYGAGNTGTSNTMGNSGTSGLSQSPYGMGTAINAYDMTQDKGMGLNALDSKYQDVNSGNKSQGTDWKKKLSEGLLSAADVQLNDILPSPNSTFAPQGNYTDWQNPQRIQSNPYQWYNNSGSK